MSPYYKLLQQILVYMCFLILSPQQHCRVSAISISTLQRRILRLIKGKLTEEKTEPGFKPVLVTTVDTQEGLACCFHLL